MRDVGVGFVLQPDEEYLGLTASICERDIDYFEVAPETLWYENRRGELHRNGFHLRFAALRERTKKPFVAHGVGFSMGTPMRGDHSRTRRWLERLRDDHATFDFRWYSDHLGITQCDGENVALPIAIEMTRENARIVRGRLRAMQRVVPDVGIENTAAHFVLGDPLDEPRFLASVTREPRTHLLLDLHNVYATAHNLGFDPFAYLDRFPLDRVIEIHVAGGSWSDPRWLPNGVSLRLDGHDDAIPEEVFAMLEHVLPRCTALRGITLERMEGSVTEADIPLLREEIRRIRHAIAAAIPREPRREAHLHERRDAEGRVGVDARVARTSGSIAQILRSADCERALTRRNTPKHLARIDRNGLRLSALLVARLRFERLLHGSDDASREFAADPARFTALFREYHRSTPMRAIFPAAEARDWSAWFAARDSSPY